MILYRAMCLREKEKTLHLGTLQYDRNREKCFSPSIDWINSRVRDGKFNNSQSKLDRYAHVLSFVFSDQDIRLFTKGKNEWKLNCREQIKPLAIEEVLECVTT